MSFTVITKQGEKTFANKELVNISSKPNFDYCLNLGFEYVLTIQDDPKTRVCTVLNSFGCDKFLFKGQPLPQRLEVDRMCKIMVKDSDEFIVIRPNQESTRIAEEGLSENDLKDLYGNDVNVAAKMKLEKRKNELEQARIAITKQVSFFINDLKHKISMNSKTGIALHIALFLASLITGFGVTNYITGLPLEDAGNILQMPINLKLVLIYAVIIYGIGLTLKQGVFLFLQGKIQNISTTNSFAEKFLNITAALLFVIVYVINLLYYSAAKDMLMFSIIMSLFFVGTCAALALACGYMKSNSVELSKELEKHEYREDFEHVVKEYQQWIERFANSLTPVKLGKIKDKLFNLQLKSVGEIILGVLTAPFLAYGVSNTLAMCFPEAAGWVRISGLRLSPVFLTLATFMIIFAFFVFVNAFVNNKKIQASNVLKVDGFSDFTQHGVNIYGLQGVKKLDLDMRRSMIIGLCIIFIEFSMNISYFMKEMGSDLNGIFLSCIAALVPTALLIAETFMLSQTKFLIHVYNDLLDKTDRV